MEGSSAATSAVENPCFNVFSASISAGLSGFASLRILTPRAKVFCETPEMRFEERMTGYEKFVFEQAKKEKEGVSGERATCVSGKIGFDLRPGWTAWACAPLFASFSARDLAKRRLAVLDCP